MAAAAVAFAVGQMAATDHGRAADYGVTIRPGLVYAVRDGTRLSGDLYLPKGHPGAAVVVAMHGGAWRSGDRSFYKYWGRFLAGNGIALFTIDYRIGKPGAYPAPLHDVVAAIRFLRAKSADLSIDPDRLGLMGDSAGAHLAAMIALASDRFDGGTTDAAGASEPVKVRAVVGFYGIYDMLAQWDHDSKAERRREVLAQKNGDFLVRPPDSITEQFLRASPAQNRRLYVQASPITYATADHKDVRFLLFHGSRDDLVDPQTQSQAFVAALMKAGFSARLIVVPGAQHFWASDAFEKDPRSYGAQAAPQLLKFLEDTL